MTPKRISICDRFPCRVLHGAIETFLVPDPEHDKFTFVTPSKIPGTAPILVYLDYCFSCGTRIDPDWVREERQRRARRRA
jgi:hypothetical protein